jgi:hypothetical protein
MKGKRQLNSKVQSDYSIRRPGHKDISEVLFSLERQTVIKQWRTAKHHLRPNYTDRWCSLFDPFVPLIGASLYPFTQQQIETDMLCSCLNSTQGASLEANSPTFEGISTTWISIVNIGMAHNPIDLLSSWAITLLSLVLLLSVWR